MKIKSINIKIIFYSTRFWWQKIIEKRLKENRTCPNGRTSKNSAHGRHIKLPTPITRLTIPLWRISQLALKTVRTKSVTVMDLSSQAQDIILR